jgi:hypothetical protein
VPLTSAERAATIAPSGSLLSTIISDTEQDASCRTYERTLRETDCGGWPAAEYARLEANKMDSNGFSPTVLSNIVFMAILAALIALFAPSLTFT